MVCLFFCLEAYHVLYDIQWAFEPGPPKSCMAVASRENNEQETGNQAISRLRQYKRYDRKHSWELLPR